MPDVFLTTLLRQGNAALKQLCDSIGSGNLAEDLFTVFADYCSKQHPKADDSPAWGNVIYYVLMAMHTSNRKVILAQNWCCNFLPSFVYRLHAYHYQRLGWYY